MDILKTFLSIMLVVYSRLDFIAGIIRGAWQAIIKRFVNFSISVLPF